MAVAVAPVFLMLRYDLSSLPQPYLSVLMNQNDSLLNSTQKKYWSYLVLTSLALALVLALTPSFHMVLLGFSNAVGILMEVEMANSYSDLNHLFDEP